MPARNGRKQFINMHPSEVVITYVDDRDGAKRFAYREPAICLVGRARDCDLVVPSEDGTLEISRHHCLLEINPPSVHVRDLSSTNGTFVNGQRIGKRAPRLIGANDTEPTRPASTPLKDGDEIQIARTPVHLTIEVHDAEMQEVGSNEEFSVAD